MSSIITHIYISQKVQKDLNLSNKFLAGSILPDMLKIMTSNRSETHYIKEYSDRPKKLPDLEKFLYENKDKLNDEITLGYYAHLIEDKIWFDTYMDSFSKCIDKQNILYTSDNTIHNYEEFKNDVYSDYASGDNYIIDTNNIDINKIRLELKGELKAYGVEKQVDENVVAPAVNKYAKVNLISFDCLSNYINESVKQVKEKIIKIVGE